MRRLSILPVLALFMAAVPAYAGNTYRISLTGNDREISKVVVSDLSVYCPYTVSASWE